MTLESDRAWLDAYRRGDRDALTRVFDAYAEDVAATLRAGVVVAVEGQRHRVGKNLPEGELEGLVHETFLKAFSDKARQQYDGLRPFGAWLATIARNLLVDRARQERRHSRLLPVDDVDEHAPVEDAPDPTWALEEQQLTAIVQRVIGEHEELDREIFRLRVREGLSCRQAADALGTTEIVVRRRDTRTRARLLDALRAEGFLKNAAIRIGASLLLRKKEQEGDRP